MDQRPADEINTVTEELFTNIDALRSLGGNEICSELKEAKDTDKDIGEGNSYVTGSNNKMMTDADRIYAMETEGPCLYNDDIVGAEKDQVTDVTDLDDCFKVQSGNAQLKSSPHSTSKTDIESSKLVLISETVSGGQIFKCSICLKSYKCRKSAEYHVKLQHKAYSLFCQVCGKAFKLQYDLDRHLNVHKGIRPFSCPECDKSFVCKSSQMRHRKFHHLVGDIYKCHNCDKTFRVESDLKRHLFTHTGERPWSCDQCSKSFVSKSSLKVHERSHDDSQKFSCTVCQKMFHIKTDLTRHESTHTGDLKWECALCQKKYSGKSAVKRHIKDSHIFGKVKYRKNEMKIEDLLDSISESCGDLKEYEAFAKYKEDNSVENLLKAVDSFVIYKGGKTEAECK